MTPPFLPYGRQGIDDGDIAAVAEVLRGPALTCGPMVDRFEMALAATVDAPAAVVCSSGTAALHLATLALALGPGDWVAVPAITFAATANAARYVGAEVAFVDVDPDTGLIDPADLARVMADKPIKAVLPVHLAGQAADMAALAALTTPTGAALVEDACHALGSAVGGIPVGAGHHSAMTVFSFHPVKTICMGEGGALTTRDPALAERLRRLRSHGITREPARFEDHDAAFEDGMARPHYYEMQELGFNYRASDLHCALGLSQLGRLGDFVAARARLIARYDAALAPLAPLVRPMSRLPGQTPGWHLGVVAIDFARAGISRAEVMRALHRHGIGSQVHYIPVPDQPYYRRRYGKLSLPGAERYYQRCLSLPLFPAMTEADVDRVVATLAAILGGE
ncbi:MAG: hypothetical protein RLZZ501_838 [Pseudomonadota bacterium]|jgi:UDP-4-amino-4,6-dideoxy-N-acetyl-beta-L-altrosamine transaminase